MRNHIIVAAIYALNAQNRTKQLTARIAGFSAGSAFASKKK
jgi:hypothetical protein